VLILKGVEAARKNIVKEIDGVFGVYGISVNIRHLGLVADYMTYSGGYDAMNRITMNKFNDSPFHKMSFETASKFLAESVTYPFKNLMFGYFLY
jgi:DNA-directed RNA polymerase I subunit RPA1